MKTLALRIFLLALFIYSLIDDLVSQTLDLDNKRSAKFKKLMHVDIFDSFNETALIYSFNKASTPKCIAACSQICTCYVVLMKGDICNLLNNTVKRLFKHEVEHPGDIHIRLDMFKEQLYTSNIEGLQNHWPIAGSTIDVIGQMNMTIQLNGQLTTDRFGNSDSALKLSKGYASVPPGVYFDPATGGFTFMAWIKIISVNSYQRIFDFGLGPDADNILIPCDGQSLNLFFETYLSGAYMGRFYFPQIELNKWYHLAVSVSGSTAILYLDGVKQGEKSGNQYRAIERTNNYFGKSNWNNHELFDGVLDDVKIFNRSLNANEIAYEMELKGRFLIKV